MDTLGNLGEDDAQTQSLSAPLSLIMDPKLHLLVWTLYYLY